MHITDRRSIVRQGFMGSLALIGAALTQRIHPARAEAPEWAVGTLEATDPIELAQTPAIRFATDEGPHAYEHGRWVELGHAWGWLDYDSARIIATSTGADGIVHEVVEDDGGWIEDIVGVIDNVVLENGERQSLGRLVIAE